MCLAAGKHHETPGIVLYKGKTDGDKKRSRETRKRRKTRKTHSLLDMQKRVMMPIKMIPNLEKRYRRWKALITNKISDNVCRHWIVCCVLSECRFELYSVAEVIAMLKQKIREWSGSTYPLSVLVIRTELAIVTQVQPVGSGWLRACS